MRYTVISWNDLPLGSKIRLALIGLGVLGVLALVLSLSLALFVVIAPIMIISGVVGSFFLRRKARAHRTDDGTIEGQYVVIEPDAATPDKTDRHRLR